MDWDPFFINDLHLILDETIEDENNVLYCIYSYSLDAVSFVDEVTLQTLKLRGIQEEKTFPDLPA